MLHNTIFGMQRILRALLLFVFLLSQAAPTNAQIEFKVILREAQVQPVSGKVASQVTANLSVLDQNGMPLKGLSEQAFTLFEDSQQVGVQVEEAMDMPITLALLMDTSGSMAGPGIEKAREAGIKFVNRMNQQDSVAVISFNETVKIDQDFSNNPSIAASALSGLTVKPGGGTCLYDAIFQALEMTSVLPEGRRALLVLTDGVDELANGDPCSSVIAEDVVRLASSIVNTPIYTVGVGQQVDENTLQRLALLSGGSYMKADDPSRIDSVFTAMYEQLKHQYRLTYESKAVPGQHTLTVQVNIGSLKQQDTRAFNIPELPPVVTIPNIHAGQTIQDKTIINAEVSGQKEAVSFVSFLINGEEAARDQDAPYTYEIDPAKLPAGEVEIEVMAADGEGALLSSASVVVQIEPQVVLPTTDAAATPEATPTQEGTEEEPVAEFPLAWVLGGGGFFLLALFGIVLVAKPFKKKMGSSTASSALSDATMDGSGLPALAELSVIFSDDTARNDEKIKITQTVTTIGRSSGNTISFPADHPVSRRHAQIEHKNGQFMLTEMLSDNNGSLKAPTFGTFLNNKKLSGAPQRLRSGDEIRLGNRLRLKFYAKQDEETGLTCDGDTIDELDDRTID